MKCTKIILSGLMAFAATANAMPTQEETKKVEPLVMDLMRADQDALKSGKKTRVEVAESAMKLADKAESEAAKLLLMKGAFNLYVRAGEFDKAIETLQTMQTAIPDMPPANMVKIIESSLRVVPRKNGGQLYRLLDETRTRMRYVTPVKQGQNCKDLYMIVDLTKTGKSAISYLKDVPKNGWNDEYRTKKIALRKIAPGSFVYLSGKSFKITKPFYIGVFEVTQKQYEMMMKVNPSEFKGDMRPVEKVSYIDIRGRGKGLNWPKDNKVDDGSYLGKLRKRTGLEFDLPTEAQWEYACRAGTKGDFNVDGVEVVKLGKCRENGGLDDKHVKVGSFLPNAWGLYDMHGNVWEWCLDRGPDGYVWMSRMADAKETDTDPKGLAVGSSRIHRGGGWYDDSFVFGCRSGRRPCIPAGGGNSLIGFRLACPAELQ